jgi:hypothetical protein
MRHLFLLLLVLLAACDPYYGYQYSGYPRPGHPPPGYAPGYQPGYYGAPPAYPGQQPYYGAHSRTMVVRHPLTARLVAMRTAAHPTNRNRVPGDTGSVPAI